MSAPVMRSTTIGIFAPASVIPRVELKMGVAQLKRLGFQVKIHPQVLKSDLFFAGSDEERARAFHQMACDDDIDVLWAARGGYGSFRLLQALEARIKQTKKKPKKKKLLLGYSDVTALHAYVREKWGWHTLHSMIPAGRDFARLPDKDLEVLADLVQGVRDTDAQIVYPKKLKWISSVPKKAIQAEVVGGNLTVLLSMLATDFEPRFSGKILFLEDVSEAPYKIDRMMRQWVASGALKGVKAIVLGTFWDCVDSAPMVLAELGGQKIKPLRKLYPIEHCLKETFKWVSKELRVPVAIGLPVGHGGLEGQGHYPLPLGAEYVLNPSGEFHLKKWSWLR